MHRFETVVRLEHTDAAGVVFFARFFELAHLAFEDFFDALGHPLDPLLFQTEAGYPLVHVEAAYAAFLRMGDRIAIEVAVVAVTRRSFTLRHRFLRGDEEVAVVTMVHAGASARTMGPIDLPADLAAALAAHLAPTPD